MTTEEIRQAALHLASQNSYEVPEAIVARAKVYADFIAYNTTPPIPMQACAPAPVNYGGLCGQGPVASAPPYNPSDQRAPSQAIWDAIKQSSRR